MSLVTLEGIKAAVPTIVPTIGSLLGRAVTVITANPAAVIIVIESIVLLIFLVRSIINNNELARQVKGSIQKGKDSSEEYRVKSNQTQEFLEQYRVSSECVINELEIIQNTQIAKSKFGGGKNGFSQT